MHKVKPAGVSAFKSLLKSHGLLAGWGWFVDKNIMVERSFGSKILDRFRQNRSVKNLSQTRDARHRQGNWRLVRIASVDSEEVEVEK